MDGASCASMTGRKLTPIPLSDMMVRPANKKKNRLPGMLEHASGDKRFKILEAHLKKHQFKQDALIEVLHKAQELFGFLEDDLLLFIAQADQSYGIKMDEAGNKAEKKKYMKEAFDGYKLVLKCDPANASAKQGKKDTEFEF